MNITGILSLFSNEHLIHSLTFSEKMSGVFATICIGMGITFLVLIVIQYSIGIMSVIISLVCKEKKSVKSVKPVKIDISQETSKNSKDIVVAITLALSQKMEEELRLK